MTTDAKEEKAEKAPASGAPKIDGAPAAEAKAPSERPAPVAADAKASSERPAPPVADAKGPASEPPPSSEAPRSNEDSPYRGKDPAKKKKGVEIAIRLTKVTKRFGNKTAVDGVSLKIKAGSVYGLIGPNGAGKTTTFSMLAGFLQPTDGAVEVLGYSPMQVDELRSRIGVLPQDAVLPPSETVGELLTFAARLQNVPSDQVDKAVAEVLAEVDGKDWFKTRCGALSHGMAKRVQLAQALLGDPDVVLLDEPTAGLDPRVAFEVRQLIKGRRGRCTLVVSSHNLHELEEICDAAAILDRGRVVAAGSIAELTAASQEVHVTLAPGPVPVAQIRELKYAKRVEFDEETRDLAIYFERGQVDAETVIRDTLWILLNNQALVSGVSKGRGLEQRVMELTD
jgi:ABC-type multidrug transport system ATPase subunit